MARPVSINIPHKLGKEGARQRLVEGFGRMRSQLTGGMGALVKFQDRWEGDRLHFEGSGMGQRITGRVDVLEDSVQMQIDLPEILAAIADRIIPRFQEEGRKLLEKK
jgi:hypothetical protein